MASVVAAQEKEEIPKPEDITIMPPTEDVELHATYYPSAHGKDAVPILLVHGWGSRRTELDPLAKTLQAAGHAVLVPDLRGHGDSSKRKEPGKAGLAAIKPEDLKEADLLMMSRTDFIAIKNELIARNNAGEFNIDLLTIVGLEFGSNIALQWTAVDWSPPAITRRVGEDVKAVVLISPQSVHKRLTTVAALRHQRAMAAVSVMVVGGIDDPKMVTEMKKIDSAITRLHPEPKKKATETEEEYNARYAKELEYYRYEKSTNLQGLSLVDPKANLKVPQEILGFVKRRVLDRVAVQDLPKWDGERKKDPVPRLN